MLIIDHGGTIEEEYFENTDYVSSTTVVLDTLPVAFTQQSMTGEDTSNANGNNNQQTSNSGGIKGFAQGLFNGFANTLKGCYTVVRHPIQTASALSNAAMHPILTAQALKDDVLDKLQTSEGIGELTFDAATIFIGATKIGKVAKAADKVSDAAGAVKKAETVANATAGKTAKVIEKAVEKTPDPKKYGPHINGPLSPSKANTFRGGVYTERTLTEDLIVYRVHGGNARQVGSYVTTTEPLGTLQAQLDLSLLSEWGNTATEVTKFRIPKGTAIYEGYAGPQPAVGAYLPGGGNQIFIPQIKTEWIVP